MRGPDRVPKVDDFIHLLFVPRLSLLQSLHLYPLELVLHDLQFLLPIQQVHDLASVYLEERHEEDDPAIGPVLRRNGVHVPDGVLGCGRHSEGLPRAGLSVGETCDHAALEDGGNQVLDLELVHIVRGLQLRERVVKLKVRVLNELRNSIYLEFTLVYNNLWIRRAYTINLSTGILLIEQWPLPHAYTQVHLRTAHMLRRLPHLILVLVDEHVELRIHILAHCLIVRLSVQLGLLLLLQFLASVLPVLLQLLYVIHHVACLLLLLAVWGNLFVVH